MPQLRMAHKLWSAVIVIVVALVAVVGFSGYRTSKAQAQADAMSREMATRVESALRWTGLTETNAARTQALVVSSDPAVEAEFKAIIPATSAQISEVQKKLETLATGDADKAQMARIAAARKAMIDLRGQAMKLKADAQHDAAVELVKQSYNPAVAAYLKTLHDFVELQRQQAQASQADIAGNRLLTVKIAAVVVGLLILAIVVGAYFLIGSIERPLEQARSLAAQIAEGDLSGREAVTRGDEFGDLLRSLYAMSEALSRMVQQVRQSTDSIATASAEIALGNQDLSARTEQTSSNLQQTAGSAMGEIVASVQRVQDIIGEISSAATEQSEGINSVNSSVVQLDQMTQQNAALVEQSTAAAESLREQAVALNSAVGTFQVARR